AGENEGVPGREFGGETLVDIAEDAPARGPRRARPGATPLADEPHLEHGALDDGADVEAILLSEARMRQTEVSIDRRLETGEALVMGQRIAASRDEIDDTVEVRARQLGIGKRRAHFGKERIR